MADHVLLDLDTDGIATITINLPETRNPLSHPDTVDQLVGILDAINVDLAVKVAILTGAGPSFSAGGDLKTLGQPGGLGGGEPVRTPGQYAQNIQRVPMAFSRLEVPIIAAVNGPAIGAGCDLACMADIRIASETARFAESFVKVGLIPGDGGAWLLPRIVGYSKACEMAFTGDALDAQAALACGLVSQVVAPDMLMETARGLAKRIAVNPSDAVRMSKRLLARGRELRLVEVLELSGALQALAHTTPEHKQVVAGLIARQQAKAV
ncbi:crotonase/enoyl-CoA hydratase family protein [Sphingomonas sp. AOB5]|uniref:crotonase/enoyl-CoA hydratase family protein n=1 Tax=Sphingomonas sp. AOB5 TaxID=3034017 RepID=UPI0023F9D79F|nr:crotonase/enoyl-CoA hydratase family protein [Sphingomonas sp. AOB5]MDF7774834.1 crotonase/enoyl-CoA hydratase family protein [Sphingomonas sp. AOB5]